MCKQELYIRMTVLQELVVDGFIYCKSCSEQQYLYFDNSILSLQLLFNDVFVKITNKHCSIIYWFKYTVFTIILQYLL